MAETQAKQYHPVFWLAFFMGLSWIILCGVLFLWAKMSIQQQTVDLASQQTRAYAREILLTRIWNAVHGGVYVFINEENQPSPYLDLSDRDLLTSDGRELTVITPAFMTEQIAEVASARENIHLRLASLDPVNPSHAPDSWEEESLQTFVAGGHERYGFVENPAGERSFRYMMPVFLEKSCLKCHAQFGHKVGDMGGGISVIIPAEPMIFAQNQQIRNLGMIIFVIWFVGILGGGLGFYRVNSEGKKREQLIQDLHESHEQVKILRGLLPICSSCKNIRDDQGAWLQLEHYISVYSEAMFTHGICPDCVPKLYPKYTDLINEKMNGKKGGDSG